MSRLVTNYLSGTITRDDERELLDLVSSDPECGERFARALEDGKRPELRGTHIPTHYLANWNSLRQITSKLEYELIQHHLRRCAACREDLFAIHHITVDASDRDRSRGLKWGVGVLAASAIGVAGSLTFQDRSASSDLIPRVVPVPASGAAATVSVSRTPCPVVVELSTPAWMTDEPVITITVSGPDDQVIRSLREPPHSILYMTTPLSVDFGTYTVEYASESGSVDVRRFEVIEGP